MLEREIKQLLTETQYVQILHSDKWRGMAQKRQLQINYYYDTKNFSLYHGDVTLRVRQIDANLNMEIKYTVEQKETYKIKQELSKPLEQLPTVIYLDKEFQEVGLTDPAYLIQPLITERTRIQVSGLIRVDLDKSSYLGVTDYELEIEFQEEVYEEAFAIYRHFFPTGNAAGTCGKKGRFFQQYFQMTTTSGKVENDRTQHV